MLYLDYRKYGHSTIARSDAVNEQEEEMFFRLLVDLFNDNPKRRKNVASDKKVKNAKLSVKKARSESKRRLAEAPNQ